jgi:hypothetical protein
MHDKAALIEFLPAHRGQTCLLPDSRKVPEECIANLGTFAILARSHARAAIEYISFRASIKM